MTENASPPNLTPDTMVAATLPMGVWTLLRVALDEYPLSASARAQVTDGFVTALQAGIAEVTLATKVPDPEVPGSLPPPAAAPAKRRRR